MTVEIQGIIYIFNPPPKQNAEAVPPGSATWGNSGGARGRLGGARHCGDRGRSRDAETRNARTGCACTRGQRGPARRPCETRVVAGCGQSEGCPKHGGSGQDEDTGSGPLNSGTAVWMAAGGTAAPAAVRTQANEERRKRASESETAVRFASRQGVLPRSRGEVSLWGRDPGLPGLCIGCRRAGNARFWAGKTGERGPGRQTPPR